MWAIRRRRGEPPRQLKGFSKVTVLSGESQRVHVWLPEASFAHWNTAANTWKVSGGKYTIYVGDSSENLPLQTTIDRGDDTLSPDAY